MRWQAPTVVIAMPISAMWRARSASVCSRSSSAQLHTGEGHIGDVQHRVEDLGAA